MKWSILYLEGEDIVFAKPEGYLTWAQNKRLTEEMLELGRKRGTKRFFIDHRNATLGLSVLEIDDLPKMFKKIGVGPEDKTAILYNPSKSASGAFAFLENVSQLSLLQFKVFSDKDEATIWLRAG